MPANTKIRPNGNVMLCVQDKKHLLVSSTVLASCSKAFAAMFSDRCVEGQQLSSTSPPMINFPEDDATAMQSLCQVAHGLRLPPYYKINECLELVVVVDQHGCIETVKPSLLNKAMYIGW